MRKSVVMGLVLGAAMGLAVSTASAQPALPLKSLPQGFKVVSQVPEGTMISFQAVIVQSGEKKIFLQPKQETLLRLLEDRGGLTPREIWDALDMTRQGAAKLIKPLMEAGLMRRVGGKKTGKYIEVQRLKKL